MGYASRLLQGCKNLFRREGFLDKGLGTMIQGFFYDLFLADGRTDNHLGLGAILEDGFQQVEPVYVRQNDVQDNNIRVVVVEVSHGLDAAGRLGDHGVALVLDDGAQDVAHKDGIVDDQDSCTHKTSTPTP